MRTRTFVALGALSLGGAWLLAAPVAGAHDCCPGHHECRGAGPHGWAGRGPGQGRAYDPDTVTTLRGTVTAVTVLPASPGRMGGTHLTLESDGKAMEVHVGPTWFLKGEGLEVAKGDVLELTGSVIDADGQRVLVARDLKRGQKAVTLRDERGVPLWSGRRP